jgi:hypothetical protein
MSLGSRSTDNLVCMFKGRFNDMYGVNGLTRGFRWNGTDSSFELIGLKAPTGLTSLTASTTQAGYVSGIQIIDGGAGIRAATIGFTGGGATTQAAAIGIVRNGRLIGATITNRGAGYTTSPQAIVYAVQGTSAAFSVGVNGSVDSINITGVGSGYTTPPTVTIGGSGITGAVGLASIDTDLGIVNGVNILSPGSGATGTGVTVGFSGSATGTVNLAFRVATVTVAHTGVGYLSPPVITVTPDPADAYGGGAIVACTVNATGNIGGVTVVNGGRYSLPPTISVVDSNSRVVADYSPNLQGRYLCCLRYVDDTPADEGGPIPSSISELKEVDCTTGSGSITWNLGHSGADTRASKVELWRTTGDQEVVLYRVASLALNVSTYVDTLSDADLLDVTRNTAGNEYGFMPIVLPNGALNARRFDPPPENMAVACMFQDRAWYAVDTSGDKPNSLYFSEVDEPESVPASNELVLQENAGDSDAIVALIPYGSSMLIAQNRHIYRLSYVAQPIFDAAIQLISYRGALTWRCWDVYAGIVFIVDSYGMYAINGSEEEAISAPIDNYWRDGIIDFSKSKFFFVKTDARERVVRFFYCRSTDGTYPTRALCYGLATQAWWEEEYPVAVPHATSAKVGSQQGVLYGTNTGKLAKTGGLVDATTSGSTAVAYQVRTPPMALMSGSRADNGSRSVSLLYTPTGDSTTIGVGVHFNNSTAARANAIDTNRGSGFTTAAGNAFASLNMSAARSPLGPANGKATAYIAGRLDDWSAGADRHMAVAITGSQSGAAVSLHGITVDGVTNAN